MRMTERRGEEGRDNEGEEEGCRGKEKEGEVESGGYLSNSPLLYVYGEWGEGGEVK